jgi:predicted SnoaL-like aldol condensation-catalyzing enzyme
MSTMRAFLLVPILIAASASCAATPTTPNTPTTPTTPTTPAVSANREVVLAFYREGLVGLQPRKAFERYVSPDFVEHKPDVEGGTREATILFLSDLMKGLPTARWEILRTIAEGDFVFLHARFVPAPGAPPYAIADVFRLQNGVIVEHWDAVGRPPEAQRNPHPRF